MGRIQSNIGLTTGIDIQGTVNQLVALSGRSRDRLLAQVKSFQTQQVAVNELTALVIGIQLQSDRLGKNANLSATTASSSDPTSLIASVKGSPTPGNYAVRTIQLAQTSTAASNPFSSSNDTLQAGDFVVRTGGFVDSSTNIDDLRGGSGISRGKIRITDRSGNSKEVDLRFVANTDDVVKAINNTEGLRISAKTIGDRVQLNDLTGQSNSNLIVEEVGEGRTAADLGLAGINVGSNSATGEDISFLSNATRLSTLRDGRGIAFQQGNDFSVTLRDGSSLAIELNSTNAPSNVGQLLSKLNAVDSTKLAARIRADGAGIELVDKTTGAGTFAATGLTASQLGLEGVSGTGGIITGARIQSTLQGPLLSSLKGGQGIGTPGQITITNRAGITTSVNLSGSVGLKDILDRINASGAGVTASLNRSRTGIVLQDASGATASNLIIADGDANNTATKLNLVANTDKSSVDSDSLALQFVSEATELSKLNQGRGVRSGSFNITNSAGIKSAVNLSQIEAKTVGDVIRAINDTNISIVAKLNSGGDGIVLVDQAGGAGTLTIEDSTNGNAALDLGIRGSAKTVTIDSVAQQQLNGSQTLRISLLGSETLAQLAEKINQANGPLSASLLTSGPSTVRLLFTSKASGEAGRIVADGSGIGLEVNGTGSARDAILAVGTSSDSTGILVRSSNNTFDNAINGVSLAASGVNIDSVQITVASENSAIEKNLQLFVDQFNKVRDKIDKETAFDPESQQTGNLFGRTEVLRVEQALTRFLTQRISSTGQVQSLDQLGISLNDRGRLQFDKSKLNNQIDKNLGDVTKFLTDSTNGFGVRAKRVLDSLVGVKNSVLVNRSQSLQRQIENGTDRVGVLNGRLERERERLLNQFYAMESNIARIRNSAGSIQQLSTINFSSAR